MGSLVGTLRFAAKQFEVDVPEVIQTKYQALMNKTGSGKHVEAIKFG